MPVSIPQAVWIACNSKISTTLFALCSFQYRKRYGLHAMLMRLAITLSDWSFNTASGMDCMQFRVIPPSGKTIRRFNTASGMDCMQYGDAEAFEKIMPCFNTASGMDCMQLVVIGFLIGSLSVSIPQAVWIACNSMVLTWSLGQFRFNTASGMDCMQ